MSSHQLKPKDQKGFNFIRSFILYRGRTPSLRAIAEHMDYGSPRSAAMLIERLTKKGYLARTPAGNLRLLREIDPQSLIGQVVELPLVGSVTCGLPMLAEENVEGWIRVSQRIAKPGATYFLLRARGDSMDQRGIQDGDLLLVRQQPVADNGDRVVALLADEATVKEFRRDGGKVLLVPRSSNSVHRAIVLESDFLIQGVVVDVLPDPMTHEMHKED